VEVQHGDGLAKAKNCQGDHCNPQADDVHKTGHEFPLELNMKEVEAPTLVLKAAKTLEPLLQRHATHPSVCQAT